ncbi:MAG: type II secretion system protein [Firmicutes bacterium]|nr:type II secretion system protein [Bacillota bacterium]
MTMGEMMVVVAIVLILAGVAFIALFNYQRSLAQLERDAIAREMFIVAQNHLNASKGEIYDILNEADPKVVGTREGAEDGAYYIIFNSADGQPVPKGSKSLLFNHILPTGSIDDTVRLGGNYVIRYQPQTGEILDVFYSADTPEKYKQRFTLGGYSDLLNARGKGKDSKKARRSYGEGHSVIGWYGGENLESLGEPIDPSRVTVENANTLNATAKWGNNSYTSEDGVVLRLIIKGKISGAERALPKDGIAVRGAGSTNHLLDKITGVTVDKSSDKHFASQFKAEANQKEFIPGEDLEIKAIAFSTKKLSNIAVSNIVVENSLFARVTDEKNGMSSEESETTYSLDGDTITIDKKSDGIPDTAYISNIRHLENLDRQVSNIDAHDGRGDNNKLSIGTAIQTVDLNWNTFKSEEGGGVSYSTGTDNYYPIPSGDCSFKNCFKPINPVADGEFAYDGKGFTIENVEANTTGEGYAGVFGIASGCAISNLRLLDCNCNAGGGSYAGALAGSLSNTKVKNVLAVNSSNTAASLARISGANAGGLAGSAHDSTVQYSAAAMTVSGSSTAGGLIGTATGNVEIEYCYSGGHTKDGSYDKWVENNKPYDVTGGTAGGFIGSSANTVKINGCYTTCSVAGNPAGGFAGTAGGGIKDSYCTGLVAGTGRNPVYRAFIGSGSVGGTGNKYYSIINPIINENGNGEKTEYLKPGDDNVKPFDLVGEGEDVAKNVNAFNEFANGTCDSVPYDLPYYNNKLYVLKPMKKITNISDDTYKDYFIQKHFGDWPSPEVFLINP